MRAFFLANGPTLVWVITALHLLFLILAFTLRSRTKEPLFLLAGCVAFGLFYDALVQALGTALGTGEALTLLSRFRFVFHGALIPLLFPICAYALDFKKPWKIAVWALTAVVIVLGVAEGFATELVPEEMAGILRCKSGEATPGWAKGVSYLLAFGTIIPVILAGVAVWIKQKTPLLLLAGLLMFVFAALGPASGNKDLNFLITMIGEVFLILFFLLYARRKAKTAS
ncbi:MAG: hypothetical protein K6G17_01730 [Oscillospiraceae bacterium]|nr:hypothetical protein [Oscillospiraceae bacterium]